MERYYTVTSWLGRKYVYKAWSERGAIWQHEDAFGPDDIFKVEVESD